MKKIATLAAFALFSTSLFSQQWDGNNNTTDQISRMGAVSIGLTDSYDRLTLSENLRMVNGKIKFGYFLPNRGNYTDSYFDIEHIYQPFSFMNVDGLYIHPSHSVTSTGLNIPNESKTLYISSSSKIGMGTNSVNCSECADYRLFVKDGIKTEKVKVEIAADNGWADYVFAKDYKLMPLQELQTFIDKKGHLPEVPTTEEAMANGIELKEMNILLLKKVEELTLYTLQQQKNLDNQNKHIEEQNKRIETLEKKLSK